MVLRLSTFHLVEALFVETLQQRDSTISWSMYEETILHIKSMRMTPAYAIFKRSIRTWLPRQKHTSVSRYLLDAQTNVPTNYQSLYFHDILDTMEWTAKQYSLLTVCELSRLPAPYFFVALYDYVITEKGTLDG